MIFMSPPSARRQIFSANGGVIARRGAGLCLGFDFTQLKNFCLTRGYRLEKCIYEHKKQIQQVEALVSQCFERFPKPHLSRGEYERLDSRGQVDAEFAYRSQTSEGPGKPQADAAVE